MADFPRSASDGRSWRTAIAVSRYNRTVTDDLLAGARAVLPSAAVIDAPGAYELPVIAAALAECGEFEGVLALGCVIKGETEHDRFINHAVADGLTAIAMRTGVPVGFGVLTCNTLEQAQKRARPVTAGGGDKGGESARALLATLIQLHVIRSGGCRPGVVLPLVFEPSDKAKGGL